MSDEVQGGTGGTGGEGEREPRVDPAQYEMLMRCSEARDVTEWNAWRKANPDAEVLLEGAQLVGAHLEHARLIRAHLEHANLSGANLEHAELSAAHLEHADLTVAHLEHAGLADAEVQHASLEGAHLEHANLMTAHLEHANLMVAHLEHANVAGASLQGADFTAATVDGGTLISYCGVDRGTDFTTVGLDAARVEPGLKQLLQYNIRRMAWQKWYRRGSRWKRGFKHAVVRPFWWVSDYGRSTGRIVATFFLLAAVFAAVYYAWSLARPPGIVTNLLEDSGGPVPARLVPVRALYFSVVTMTTLGFGDMYARGQSLWGHILLTVQVLSGYVLLGALVTRLAILFTAGGPSAAFAKKKSSRPYGPART